MQTHMSNKEHSQPCTGFAAAVAIEMATKDNVDWLLHIDTDELMYPGGSAKFSLQDVLATFPDDVDTVVFPNYESLPESSKVHDPFTEVSMLITFRGCLQGQGPSACTSKNSVQLLYFCTLTLLWFVIPCS